MNDRKGAANTKGVVQILREKIVTCSLAPGSVVQDAELAEMLNVSTSPVREALVQLQIEGLVEALPYRTKRIAPLDRQSANDFYVVFSSLFMFAMSTGVPNMKSDGIARMGHILSQLYDSSQQGRFQEYYQQQRRFLNPIIAASPNREIERTILLSSHWLNRASYVLGGERIFTQFDYFESAFTTLVQGDQAGCIAALKAMSDNFGRNLATLPEA